MVMTMRMIRKRNECITTNEWYIFHDALDKKTCNKIKRLAKDNWEDSGVDTSKGITDEERKTGQEG